jgi:hypothetical protein
LAGGVNPKLGSKIVVKVVDLIICTQTIFPCGSVRLSLMKTPTPGEAGEWPICIKAEAFVAFVMTTLVLSSWREAFGRIFPVGPVILKFTVAETAVLFAKL